MSKDTCSILVKPIGRNQFKVDLGPHADFIVYTEEKLPKFIKYAMARHEDSHPEVDPLKIRVLKSDVDEVWPGEGRRDYYKDFRDKD